MDRYLFRALRTDGEGWAYGGYFYNSFADQTFIVMDTIHSVKEEVIPETVGQWTGLTCNNRTVNVFEGDKFRYRLNGRYYVSVVIFNNGCFGFMERGYFMPLYELADSQGDLDYFEVIGNIHEGKDNA